MLLYTEALSKKLVNNGDVKWRWFTNATKITKYYKSYFKKQEK